MLTMYVNVVCKHIMLTMYVNVVCKHIMLTMYVNVCGEQYDVDDV